MRRFVIISGFISLLAATLAGCGGGSSASNKVAQIVMAPTTISLNSGDVAIVTANIENSSGSPLSSFVVTYATSNNSLVTVSPSGQICGGVWDTQFIVCNGDDASGNPLSGTATITASAGGVTSGPVPVTVHVKVTSVAVDTQNPAGGCVSSGLTQQFTGHACSSIALPHDATGPCSPNAKEVTSLIGPFAWGAVDTTVATVDTNGLATAQSSGITSVFASVSNVNSAPIGFRTCMPIELRLHLPGDLPGALTTSSSMTQNATLTLEVDMTDELGVSKNSVATILVSDQPVVAPLSGTGSLTVTASSFGGSGIVAGCTPQPGNISSCGNGLNTPIYSNLFRITVPGNSPAPIVYATSSFAPPSGTSPTLLPIDTSKSPPSVGTAIDLPGVPNSMVMSADGSVAYLGTTAGLVSFTPGTSAVTIVDPSVVGKVLAVSPAGTKVIVSNAAADPQGNVIEPVGPSQRLWIFDKASGTTQIFVKPGAVAAAIDNDGFRDYIATNDGTGNIYVFSPSLTLQTMNIPGTTATSVASLPSDAFIYVANTDGLDVVATCSNAQQPIAHNPPTNSKTIQLVQSVPGSDTIVAVDSPGVDIETVSVTSILSGNPTLPFVVSPATCQPNVSYSNEFLNFGVGPFTAHQLLVATGGGSVAVLPFGISSILTAFPGSGAETIPLATGATEAFSGGMTPDGLAVWVGVGGSNTVDKVQLFGGGDVTQVPTSFKKLDGTAAPPDIVAVTPK